MNSNCFPFVSNTTVTHFESIWNIAFYSIPFVAPKFNAPT
jgi:hypothetical protein